MRKSGLSVGLAVSLAMAVPTTASADLGDAIAGGVVGAIINQTINNSKQQRVQQQRQPKRTVTRQPTINDQYTRTERMQIQTSLNGLGYNVGVVDGALGPRSRNAISQFQASRGEAATGLLTRAQYVALIGYTNGMGTPAVVTQRNLQPNEVVMLQQSLQRLGYYHGRIDGLAGGATAHGVQSFLLSQNRNPQMTAPVEALQLAAMAAGMQLPPYIHQEAAMIAASRPGNQFQQGYQQQNPNTFVQPGGQQVFGNPQQQQNVAAPNNGVFATPQPQQVVAPQTNNPFAQPGQPVQNPAANGQFQQQPVQQPQVVPGANDVYANTGQGQQPAPLFATTNPATAPQQGQGGAVVQQAAQPQSSLDIFAGTPEQQPAAAAAIAAPVNPTAQQGGEAAINVVLPQDGSQPVVPADTPIN
ncbi:peptidoglycan-binding protein [Amaricoccus tamworthensis]|uniref:peptidoglycan-binding domain-containing protein n=1 Tax=Amaricoccus tamworthensis TaxID=57002 RepID=UPI003C7C3133